MDVVVNRYFIISGEGEGMPANESRLEVVQTHSNEESTVPLADLTAVLNDFCAHLCVAPLVDQAFMELMDAEAGADKVSRLLAGCGYANDPKGFFTDLLGRLGKGGSGPIEMNGVALPHLLLVAILEVALPGNRFITVRSVEQLEQVANMEVSSAQRNAMQAVIDTYPVRLSMHTLRQMRVSPKVAYQYLPFIEELDPAGHTNTWIGQFHQGLLEQMYQNRVIFLLNMSCPVYCRFCFRKHKEARNEANPTPADVQRAVGHVARSPAIKEIVITGGDPFMNRKNLAAAIDGLMAVDHVQTLRLATRSIAYYPHLFLGDDGELLNYLKRKRLALGQRGKRMEVATHFIHPDEISPQSLRIITDLVKNGIPVYVQTPFLNDCNDQGPELVRLFSLLRGAGAELHYIYIPCSPIHGNSVYWAPISKGLAVGNYLRAHLSDRVIPRICTATPIGKMDWHTSGWAVEPVADNNNFIWIRSPYTPDYFKHFAPLANELDNIRVNAEGTIDIQYMAQLGDDALFFGARPKRTDGVVPAPLPLSAAEVQSMVRAEEGLAPSIVPTPSTAISRLHETRVELAPDFSETDLAYISADTRISDVVVVSPGDALDALPRIRALARTLRELPHVNALRLRSLDFALRPQRYTPALIDALGGLNHLTIVSPLRLEIETQFLTADEVRPEHTRLVRRLNEQGITVYANTPLLGRINAHPDAVHELAYACRRAGIEFHHLYVAGLPLQNRWNADHPVALHDVIDIATRVRREGSGREVPRYIIRTALGEVDFGLGSRFVGQGRDIAIKLLPYDLAYYRSMAPDFVWPAEVSLEGDGSPILPVGGLRKQTDFALS
jgi:L-lysine 2,3-aminomutase